MIDEVPEVSLKEFWEKPGWNPQRNLRKKKIRKNPGGILNRNFRNNSRQNLQRSLEIYESQWKLESYAISGAVQGYFQGFLRVPGAIQEVYGEFQEVVCAFHRVKVSGIFQQHFTLFQQFTVGFKIVPGVSKRLQRPTRKCVSGAFQDVSGVLVIALVQ